MRLNASIGLLLVTAWTSSALQQPDASNLYLHLEARAMDDTGYAQLPHCAKDCGNRVLPAYECSSNDAGCFCNNENLTASMSACVMSNCTIENQLATAKVRADICGLPLRDRGPLTRRLDWAMFVFATTFVAGRVASRARQFGGSGCSWDDWTVLFCYVLLVPTDVVAELEVQEGLGKDMYENIVPEIVTILHYFYLGELFYNIIVMLTKVSMVLLCLRIWTADSTTRAFRIACWILIGVLNATWVAGALVVIFQCHPISYTWTKVRGTTRGTCLQLEPFTYAYAAVNICFDVIVFSLPVRSLLKLRIPFLKKTCICFAFLVGFLVTICSVIRLQYLVRISGSRNITYDFQYIVMWSLVEANFSIVCCCMPAMAGLVQRCYSHFSGRDGEPFSNSSIAMQQAKDGAIERQEDARRSSHESQVTDTETQLKTRW